MISVKPGRLTLGDLEMVFFAGPLGEFSVQGFHREMPYSGCVSTRENAETDLAGPHAAFEPGVRFVDHDDARPREPDLDQVLDAL